MRKDLGKTIMVSNLFATILAVTIHYKSHWILGADKHGTINFLVQEFQAIGLGSTAVPFFALFSGFFE